MRWPRVPLAITCVFSLFIGTGALCATKPFALARSADSPILVALPLAHETASVPQETSGGEDEGPPQSGWAHFVWWIGHFHPPMTVFPIAMVLGAALAETLRLVTRAAWLDGASRFCMIVGGIGAAITACLGWAFAEEHPGGKLLEIHRWLGTAAGAGAVVLLVLSEIARRRPGALTLFRVVLFAAVPLVAATGFFGGAMVYGTDEYAWNPPREHESHHAGGQETHGATAASQPAQGGIVEVTMTDDEAFKPATVTVSAGSTVRWKNTSKDTHTVTDDPRAAGDPKDVSSPEGSKPFNSGKIKPGDTYEQKFTLPGTYQYVCKPHEEMDMKGRIIVTAKSQ